MAPPYHQISNLLEKMSSLDKDFRFMATNDLIQELQKDSIKLDDESEKKVVRMVLRLLEDKNGEVQNMAVKCLVPLVIKIKETHVESVVDSLCSNMTSTNEQLRDISSIGLKTVIAELPQQVTVNPLAPKVCQRITGKLCDAIAKEDVSVKLESLDILTDLLSRFGELLFAFHELMLQALVPQLESGRQAVRKRTIVALSHLLITCEQKAYNTVIQHLFNGLEKPKDHSAIRTNIQCLASICRLSGHRLHGHIDKIMCFLKEYSRDEDDEIREFCLQACEAFVYRCSEGIGIHIPLIVELCLYYIRYDPNYNYEAEIESNIGMDTEEEEDIDSEEYSDDDDMSWKVRRSAAKCLEAIISTRPELIEEFYKTLSPALIARFKEREENVKSDIFHAYIALLKVTRPHDNVTNDPDSMDQVSGPICLLQEQIPNIINAVQPLMREKSLQTRLDCFLLLRELLNALPDALTNHFSNLMYGLQYSLNDKNTSNLKTDALGFLCSMLQTHNPLIFHPHMEILASLIVSSVFDPFYKISTEALLVLQHLVKVIRPLDINTAFDFIPYVARIYNCTLDKLKSQDVDQEVKERAIACMGQIIANMGDALKVELIVCFPIFLERLRNEVTRLSAVKALTMIAASPLHIDMSPILKDAIPALGAFLRKNQRALKLNSLTLLDTLVINDSEHIDSNLLKLAINELPPLISDTDLHVAQLSISLLTSVAIHHSTALHGIHDTILPELMLLVRSPLLQGMALNSTLNLFQALVQANLPELSYRQLLEMLMLPILSPHDKHLLHKQAYHSLAKCVAALTLRVPHEAIKLASELLHDIQRHPDDSLLLFCLLTIGEIGRHFDLSSIEALPVYINDCFETSSEDVKSGASHALGAIAVGNLSFYLPIILHEIENNKKRQYLLIHSLKELITSLSNSQNGLRQLLPSVPSIWSQLFKYCEYFDEGSRNVVAECLGKLVLVNPEELLPRLKEALGSDNIKMRTAVVSAIKFTISDQPQPIDTMLRQCIGQFLYALKDPDLGVRRVALIAFNSAVHNKPILVRDLLSELLPCLYLETKIKKELIREVEMGPFKHTVDDGLDIRKAAFECMYTLLEQGLERVDIMQFIDYVQAGLKDHYDIKMLTYLMTARLATLCPHAVLQKLSQFVEPIRETCILKVKANSVKQEYEKQEELKRSALRAFSSLASIPTAEKNMSLSEFIKFIKESAELKLIYESVQKDTTNSNYNNNNLLEVSMDQS